MTQGRQRLMADAIDKSALRASHRAVLKHAVLKYADGNGLWFTDQKDWASDSGYGRATVQRAVYAAVEAGILLTSERVYTTNGRKGTSIYVLRPSVWSRKPEKALKAVQTRLAGLTKKPACVHQDDARPCITVMPLNGT